MTFSRRLPPIFLAAMLAATPAAARQSLEPRVVVDQIAQAVADNYFDPARGAQFARQLRAEAAEGRYDALRDPDDLQVELTRRMKDWDRHFNVGRPSAGPTTPHAGPASLEPVPFEIGVARRGQGFRRVELLPGNVALVDMTMFIDFEAGSDPARRQADAVLTFISGADAVIFDLRDNGGGAPAMVGYLVSAFVPAGANVYNTFHERQGQVSEAPREPFVSPRTDVPVYILTSGRTGSAAEAFAYTLQAAGRATVVGERTAGAANPGGPVRTPSGFTVFVSDGAPINPITGKNWEGDGVQPDLPAASSDALALAWKAALGAQTSRLSGAVAVEAKWVLEALNASSDLSVDPQPYVGDYSGSRIESREGSLTYQNGRRPAWRLRPLSADLFFDMDAPWRRVRFHRDAEGMVSALETLDAQTGGARRYRRGE